MENFTLSKKNSTFALLLLFFTTIGFAQSQTFNPGSNTFTVPAGVTSITVQVWGGGGKGGTRTSSGVGGGGGGGGFAIKTMSVTPGNTYTAKVGSGSSSSSAGGDSWFGSATTVLAKGGNSVANNTATGAAGGAASTYGDFRYAGGNGETGSSSNYSGGGGSSGGNGSDGDDGSNQHGGSVTGGGDGGDGKTSSGDGSDGSKPGGGGGGGYRTVSGTRNGGDGGDGMIVVTWTIPEIDIKGNGTTITDGDSSPSTGDWTDFATANIGTPITRTYTIYNTGTATLTIGTITISGTNAADFSITTAPDAIVAAGGNTTLVVTFDPGAAGTRTAAINIVNNDFNENPYNFSIQGTGVIPVPEINVQGNATTINDGDTTPSATDWTIFGSTDITYGTIPRTFTIQNTGSGPLSITGVTISGTNAADFSVTSAPASTVAAGGSTTFVITFNPTVTGTKNATINIANNDSNENPYNFAIQGTAIDPEINVQGNATDIVDSDTTPTTTDWTSFGTTDIVSGTLTRTFTIQNKSTASGPLSVGAISFTGTNASDFSVTTAPASSVAVNGSTTFVVTFNPSAIGIRTAIINIANNDSNENPYNFTIQGSGADPEINLQGNATDIADGTTTTSTSDWTSFGTTDIGTGTLTRTFTIQNKSTATISLSVGSITFTGANAADFSVTTAPASSVAIGASTTFVVTFNPSAIGIRTATINIANNDSDENPYDFAVTGTGADPEIDLLGNALSIADGDSIPSIYDGTDFGNVEYTAATVSHTFTIANSASASMPLTVGAITFTGVNPGDYSVTSAPASSVAIGGSTTFTVTFNPSGTGSRITNMHIANNDSNENAYDVSLQGIGTNPEINLMGNLISITDGDTTPSVSDNTDFGTVSIDAGSTLVTYTIQNTGTGTMNIGAITFSGANAADFSVVSPPASTIASGSSTSFVVSFGPSTVGTKTATISIVNDDANENPYNFSLSGLGVRTYADTDGDGISDNLDKDDDNDGIPDTVEQAECSASPFAGSVTYTFLNETFGTGTTKGLININIPGATCTYCFEDGIVGPDTVDCPSQSSKILDDGEYTVVYKIAGTTASDPENIHGDLAWNGLEDHTVGDVNGRMAVFNASFTPGIFYETTITGIMPNVPVTYSFWALNIMSVSNFVGSILPNITVEFLDTSGTVLSTYNTGDIGRCGTTTTDNTCTYSQWRQYTTSVNLGSNTSFTVRFKNNAPGGGGNDLALDDITLKQQYCDFDGDGIADIFDLDSDNDGIPDIEEAGFKNMSSGKATMDRTLGTWADTNNNGLADSIDAMITAGTYSIPDTDGDGAKDFHDLDSDNDSIFDVDEANLLNGDGDINGDGFGDGIDTDKDGILDLFDNSAGFGTNTRAFATDTDGNGIPDYRQLDSNSDGVNDIVGTLYNSYDVNGDGKIDGSTDIDKDGILDSFDTKTTALGSPRDLNRKLFLDFDGRNDYGEAPQMLSSLPKATIMGWIKLSNPYTATGFVIGQDNFNLKVDTSSGNKLTATAKGITVTYPTALSVDRWYHITAVYDGSNSTEKLKLYVNGQEEQTSNSGTLSGNLAASTAKFTFGKNATASTEYFKGSIDEVRVFNTALTTDQIQKMVYQEIKQNGTAIRGEIVPKDIESSLWANVLAYYRMDAYKDDVIDNYTTGTVDSGTSPTFARIYNVKNIKYQLAPMPFVTTMSGAPDVAVSQNNFVNGNDLYTYNWSILQVKHNINLNYNLTGLGLFVDPSVNFVLNNDNMIKNTWYMLLNGKMDLQGKSQLVQTGTSDLDPVSSGYIERDQQGTVNEFNYNYWSSPVGAINSTTNNNSYTVAGVMKDGTNPANPQNIQWTSGLNGSATSPITLSSYWIFKFQNVTNDYANWASVGPTGALTTGQGYTLKGSDAATATQNYTFVGKPNSGIISIPIAANNLNLCGNPYASALDANAFITDNASALTGTLYFWEHFSTNTTHILADYQGGYAIRTLVGGTPPVSPSGISGLGNSTRTPGRFIPVGQGFFVTANTTGGNVKFNNDQRAFIKEDNAASNIMFKHSADHATPLNVFNNNEDVFEPDTYAKLRVGFNSVNNYHRQILLGFMDDKATAGIDPGYDAIHIDNQPNDMYFINGTSLLNIQGDGYFNTANIYPLGVKTGTAGTVSFTLDAKENFDENQPVYIYDNVTQLYHDITDEKFEIELPTGTIDDRFSLRFTGGTALGVGQVSLESGIFAAYANANSIITIKNNVEDATVETATLYNMLGQLITSWKVENQDQHNIQLPVKYLSTGTYIVKMKTTKGDISKKIIVK